MQHSNDNDNDNDDNKYIDHLKKEEEKQKSINKIQGGTAVVSGLEAMNFTTIYSMFLTSFLHKFLEETAKYFLFPLAILGNLIQAALAWREVHLEQGKYKNKIMHAVVETFASAAIAVAVIGALAASTIFGLITPIIFTVVTAAKMIFHLGSAIYFAIKASTGSDSDKAALARQRSVNHGIAALAGTVSLIAIVGVFLLGKVVMAGIGIGMGIFGTGYALYKGITGYQEYKKKKLQASAQLNPRIIEDDRESFSPVPELTDRPDVRDNVSPVDPIPHNEHLNAQLAHIEKELESSSKNDPIIESPVTLSSPQSDDHIHSSSPQNPQNDKNTNSSLPESQNDDHLNYHH